MPITFITGMPEPNLDLNDLVMNIDTVQHKNIAETMFASMNEKQKEFFTMLQEASNEENPYKTCFYLEGAAGTGKTFCYLAIYHDLMSRGKLVKNMASTAMAADLLPTGRTINFKAGVRPPIDDRSITKPSFKLTENQRVDPEEVEFLETLTQLGDGVLQDKDEGEFEFPKECISDNVLDDVYENSTTFLLNCVITWNLLHFLQEMPSLLNKRAPSSSDNSRSAVGFACMCLLGKFASSDYPLHSSLDDANARGTFPGSFNYHTSQFRASVMALQHFAPMARFFCVLNLQFSAH
ncbi:PIF1-like helicase domain-containing protein [Ditylenchus destructor]|nr:PIF1-like helicase domain-containing protein [Ditylenchus destructor]